MAGYLHPNYEHVVRGVSITVIKGADCLHVLDRTVSTKLTEMVNLDRKKTMFCDANGRIEDIATIHIVDDQVLMVSSQAESTQIRKKLVSGVSWDEDCEVLDGDQAISQVSLLCSEPRKALSEFGVIVDRIAKDKVLESGDLLFSITELSNCSLVEILVPSTRLGDVLSSLERFGSQMASKNRWDFLRISKGILSIEDARGNLPDELGLGELASLDKGCYPGQEIHARLESRGKTVKQIVRISSESTVVMGKQRVDSIGRINVTSSQSDGGVNLSLAICPTLDEKLLKVTLVSGGEAVLEPLNAL